MVLVPVGSDRAERMVEVGSVPRAIALGFDATWVTDLTDQTVTRVGEDDSLTTTGLGVTATGLAAGRDAMWAIASNEGDVIRFESMTGRVLVRIPLAPGLTDIAAGDQSVRVTNADAGTVTQIDARRNEPVATIANLAGTIWAANQGAGTVTQVNLRERTTQVISVGRLPTAVAASGNAVYALNDLDHSVTQIDETIGEVVRTLSLSDPLRKSPGRSRRVALPLMIEGYGCPFRVLSCSRSSRSRTNLNGFLGAPTGSGRTGGRLGR
jgi:DNA-binding beta-propeller fold protein YncE